MSDNEKREDKTFSRYDDLSECYTAPSPEGVEEAKKVVRNVWCAKCGARPADEDGPEVICRCSEEAKNSTPEDGRLKTGVMYEGTCNGEAAKVMFFDQGAADAYTIVSLRTQLEQAQQELHYKELGLKAMAELNNAGSALIRELRGELEQAKKENEELERQVDLEIHDRDASITRAQALEVELKQMAEALEKAESLISKLVEASSVFAARVQERNPDWFEEPRGSTDFADANHNLALKLAEARRKG